MKLKKQLLGFIFCAVFSPIVNSATFTYELFTTNENNVGSYLSWGTLTMTGEAGGAIPGSNEISYNLVSPFNGSNFNLVLPTTPNDLVTFTREEGKIGDDFLTGNWVNYHLWQIVTPDYRDSIRIESFNGGLEWSQGLSERFPDYSLATYHGSLIMSVDPFSLDAASRPAWYLQRVVPVPAAVWLFGSGLIGLIGVAKRKKS